MIRETASFDGHSGSPTPGMGPRLPWWQQSVILGTLAGVVALAWAYLYLHSAHLDMSMAAHLAMGMSPAPWTAGQAGLTLAMWAVMMAAMMLPSAVPMLLLYNAVAQTGRENGTAFGRTSLFGLGYLAIWVGFSVGAVALQYGLHEAALLSPMMEATSIVLAGVLLIVVGLYQWTPLKRACLGRCRSPLQFIMTQWRPGPRGAWVMGLRHGAYCLGCCWALMLLLFLGGVMNLVWVAGIALYVLIEKFAPHGPKLSRATGALLMFWGVATLVMSYANS